MCWLVRSSHLYQLGHWTSISVAEWEEIIENVALFTEELVCDEGRFSGTLCGHILCVAESVSAILNGESQLCLSLGRAGGRGGIYRKPLVVSVLDIISCSYKATVTEPTAAFLPSLGLNITWSRLREPWID